MIFVQNQKGSPTIKNFSATIKYVLATYIKKYNAEQDNKEKYLWKILNLTSTSL